MTPRTKRLSRPAFKEVLSSSRRRTSLHFSVSSRKTSGVQGSCAAVVSKKVAKSSVDRHLLKRRMLAVARPFLNTPFSFIIYARAGSPSLPFKKLSEELASLLSDAFKEV